MVYKHKLFCACAFMDSIYVFGGCDVKYTTTNSCLEFSTKDNSWKEVTGINIARSAVFLGNVVVSGGILNNSQTKLNSVESYDVFADK